MFHSEMTGLDITSQGIKAVSVKCTSKGYFLKRAQCISFSKQIVDKEHGLDYQEIANKLKELRKQLTFLGRKVAIVIPDSAVVSRFVQIESSIQTNDREYAIYEAFSALSPIARQELRLDFVEDSHSLQEGMVGYQVYAARKSVIDQSVLLAEQAKLTPILIDTQSHCLFKVWQMAAGHYKQNHWIILCIDSNQIIICSGGSPALYKTVPVVLNTKNIEDEIKINPILLESLAESVFLQIQLYSASGVDSNNHKVMFDGVWVTGDTELLEPFREALEKKASLKCRLLKPLTLLSGGNLTINTCCQEYGYSFALGAALKGLLWLENV